MTICSFTRNVNEKLQAFPYVLIEDFLDAPTCDFLVAYQKQNMERLAAKQGETHNEWAGRVIWYPRVDVPQVKAIMRDARERITALLQETYHVAPLYTDGVQLVVWPEGKGMPPHADNMHIDGKWNELPWREYAAVVYLNDDYDAGEFYFANTAAPCLIKPGKGSLVAFGGGLDYAHGVNPSIGSARYTMPSWYTRDIRHREPEY